MLETNSERRKPLSAGEWRPIFERALVEYVLASESHITTISVRNLTGFMQQRNGQEDWKEKGYPEITEDDSRRVKKLMSEYLKRTFGKLWDGAVYTSYRGKTMTLIGAKEIAEIARSEIARSEG